MRDETIDAIAVWCGSLEAAVAEQNTLPNTGPAVQQALLGLGELAAAVVLVSVDASPDWVGKPVLVESAVSTLFETMTEEGLAEGAAKSVADQKAKYYQNLVSSPEITASAKKYGLPPETVARDLADDFVEQMTQAIRSVTPLVLRVAKEPWSVAALEERLAAATAGTGRRGSAVTAVDEPAPAAPGRSAAAWYADPSGRHQYRYWDGTRWTPHVANNGETSVDPLDSAPDKDGGAEPVAGRHAIIECGNTRFTVDESVLGQELDGRIAYILDLRGENIEELLRTGKTEVVNVVGLKQQVALEYCECPDMASHVRT